jgi:hypothetical protein
MARLPQNPRIKTRTEREDLEGRPFVIIAGAPKHYIAGFGVVGPGDVITLPEGVEPGVWLEPINEKDAAKVAADPAKAEALAAAAAARKDEAGELPLTGRRLSAPTNAEVQKGAGIPVSDDAAAKPAEKQTKQ